MNMKNGSSHADWKEKIAIMGVARSKMCVWGRGTVDTHGVCGERAYIGGLEAENLSAFGWPTSAANSLHYA